MPPISPLRTHHPLVRELQRQEVLVHEAIEAARPQGPHDLAGPRERGVPRDLDLLEQAVRQPDVLARVVDRGGQAAPPHHVRLEQDVRDHVLDRLGRAVQVDGAKHCQRQGGREKGSFTQAAAPPYGIYTHFGTASERGHRCSSLVRGQGASVVALEREHAACTRYAPSFWW